jgi:hypothetical protein
VELKFLLGVSRKSAGELYLMGRNAIWDRVTGLGFVICIPSSRIQLVIELGYSCTIPGPPFIFK